MNPQQDFIYALDDIISTNSGIAVIPAYGRFQQVIIKKINQHSFSLITTGIDCGYKFKCKISDLEMIENEQGITFILKKFQHEGIPQTLFPDNIIKFKICEFF